MHYTPPKGTFDIIPCEKDIEHAWRESHRWQYIEHILRSASHDFSYREIRVPLFEQTELFIRSVGEHTDIVSKEMYTFLDRAGRSMTLRPEGTAGVMRAILEKGLHMQPGLHKFFYIGPMFRYDRPQAGRYRQLHQYGVEVIGRDAPEQDVEVIALLYTILQRLQMKDLHVQINSIGDLTSRAVYKEALRSYLAPHLAHLSKESQHRFEKNIMRVLDSKDPEDQEVLQKAPSILDFLRPEAKSRFDQILSLLKELAIPYAIQPRLVRGLDYYTDTVFEVHTKGAGAQNALGGGGRYDGLSEALGGPFIPAVGFSVGMERILQWMLKESISFPSSPHPKIFLIPLGNEAKRFCIRLAQELRTESISTECDLSGKKMGASLQLATAMNAEYALIIGENELKSGAAALKHLASREQTSIAFNELIATLKEKCYA